MIAPNNEKAGKLTRMSWPVAVCPEIGNCDAGGFLNLAGFFLSFTFIIGKFPLFGQ